MPFHAFENPVVSLTLVNEEGGDVARIPLWTNSATGEAFGEQAIPSLAVVTDVTVELVRGDLARITCNLSLPYEAGLQLINGNFILWGKTRLEVFFGYVRDLQTADTSPVFSGTIFDPEISWNEGRMDLVLVAQAVGAHDARGRGHGHSETGLRRDLIKRYANVKHTGTIAQSYRKLEVSFKTVDEEGGVSRDLLFETVTVSAGWSADWMVIQRLLIDAQCWGYFDGFNLEVIPWALMLKSPRFILRYFHQPGVPFGPGQGEGHTAGGTWPILSFNSPTMGQYFVNIHRGLYTSGIDADGESFGEVIKPTKEGEAEPRTGTGSVKKPDEDTPEGDPKTGTGFQPKFSDGKPTPEEIQRAAADKQVGQSDMGILVEIETLGMPNLVPGRDSIKIEGFGELYDKNYPVEKVTHIISEGGFISQIVARSNTSAVHKAVAAPVRGTLADKEPDTGESEGEIVEAGGGT